METCLSGCDTDELVHEASTMTKLTVSTQIPYHICIAENILSSQHLIDLCNNNYQTVIITDDNVEPLYGTALTKHLESHNINTHLITIPHGEASKSREMKCIIEDQLFELGCGRDTGIIALGGGVVTDLAGYVAATYCRGVPAIYLPTTLLAMVDAAIGGKTGINTTYGKNLLGTFTQPKAVLADVNTVATLPESEYTMAFAEIIKHAVVYDREYFSLLNTNADKLKQRDPSSLIPVINKSCEIKSTIVVKDEKESGIRAILNFGHTIGHALEKASHYQLSHGQAVALGMIGEAYISNQLGHLSNNDFQAIESIIEKFDIPLQLEQDIIAEEIKKSLITDKKSRKKTPKFVLLKRIGGTFVSGSDYTVPVDEMMIDDALRYLNNEIGR